MAAKAREERMIARQGGGVQTQAVSLRGWSRRKRERFLEALASTCNVTRSAELARMDKASAYRLRARDEAFREQWMGALAIGYETVEMQLLEAATQAGEPRDDVAEGGRPAPRCTPGDAIRLLTLHRKTVSEERARRGPAQDVERLIGEILERLERLAGRCAPTLESVRPERVEGLPSLLPADKDEERAGLRWAQPERIRAFEPTVDPGVREGPKPFGLTA